MSSKSCKELGSSFYVQPEWFRYRLPCLDQSGLA